MLKRNSINAHSNTLQVTTGWPYRWFYAKSPLVLRSFWILNECNLYSKIVKYCILSEVCMIKTAPHSTVLPQMWCKKRLVYTSPDLLARFCKANLSNPKNSLWFVFQEFVLQPNLPWSRAVALKCDRRWSLCFGCTYRLSTRCKICFTLGLFANYFSIKSLSLSIPQKSHECALKLLPDLWNTSLLFDLNYKFIIRSFAFSPG